MLMCTSDYMESEARVSIAKLEAVVKEMGNTDNQLQKRLMDLRCKALEQYITVLDAEIELLNGDMEGQRYGSGSL